MLVGILLKVGVGLTWIATITAMTVLLLIFALSLPILITEVCSGFFVPLVLVAFSGGIFYSVTWMPATMLLESGHSLYALLLMVGETITWCFLFLKISDSKWFDRIATEKEKREEQESLESCEHCDKQQINEIECPRCGHRFAPECKGSKQENGGDST